MHEVDIMANLVLAVLQILILTAGISCKEGNKTLEELRLGLQYEMSSFNEFSSVVDQFIGKADQSKKDFSNMFLLHELEIQDIIKRLDDKIAISYTTLANCTASKSGVSSNCTDSKTKAQTCHYLRPNSTTHLRSFEIYKGVILNPLLTECKKIENTMNKTRSEFGINMIMYLVKVQECKLNVFTDACTYALNVWVEEKQNHLNEVKRLVTISVYRMSQIVSKTLGDIVAYKQNHFKTLSTDIHKFVCCMKDINIQIPGYECQKISLNVTETISGSSKSNATGKHSSDYGDDLYL